MSRKSKVSYPEICKFIRENQPVAANVVADHFGLKLSAFSYRLKMLQEHWNVRSERIREGRTQIKYLSTNSDTSESKKSYKVMVPGHPEIDKVAIPDTPAEEPAVEPDRRISQRVHNIINKTMKARIPSVKDLIQYCKQNKSNNDCKLILKYIKANSDYTKGSQWFHPIQKALSVVKDMVGVIND